MRAILLCLSIWCGTSSTAWSEPVYFVVDASKSMDNSELQEAADFIQLTKDGLPPNTQTSTTLFGSKTNGGDCGAVTISSLSQAAEVDFGEVERGNHTPIGAALSAALEQAEANNGRVILISDGVDTCEADVCGVLRQHLRQYPQSKRPEFMPVGAADTVVDGYGCFVAAVAASAHQLIKDPALPPSRPPLWGIMVIAFSALLVCLSMLTGIVVMGARTRGLGKQISSLNETETKLGNPVTAWMYLWTLAPITLATIILVAAWWNAPADFHGAWKSVWWFLNLPSGSMLLPAALLGFGGWALVKLWDISETRRKLLDTEERVELDKRKRAEQANQREQKRLRKRVELLERMELLRDQAARRRTLWVSKAGSEETRPRLENLNNHIGAVSDRLEVMLQSISDNRTLSEFAPLTRTDYLPILERALARKILAAKQYEALVELFGLWNGIVAGTVEFSSDTESAILKFDVHSLLHR